MVELLHIYYSSVIVQTGQLKDWTVEKENIVVMLMTGVLLRLLLFFHNNSFPHAIKTRASFAPMMSRRGNHVDVERCGDIPLELSIGLQVCMYIGESRDNKRSLTSEKKFQYSDLHAAVDIVLNVAGAIGSDKARGLCRA